MPATASRILINANIDSFTHQRGVARYFKEVTAGIIATFGNQTVVLSPEAGDYAPARHIRSINFRGSRRFRIRDVYASLVAAHEKVNVVFNPYYGRLWTLAPSIFTVYDMIPELLPHYATPGTHLFVAEKKRCFERADVLVAISHSTARDIVACYPHLAAKKIVVTQLGVDQSFFRQDAPSSPINRNPYLLFVGNRDRYKNFLRFVTAFGQSGVARQTDLLVVSPLGAGFTPQELDLINTYNLTSAVQLITSPSDEALRDYYAGAMALFYPSEYEGFGLPILEAMASGTLVATSNVSSMPEIGGDAAFYFDPYNTDSMVNCMQQIIDLPTKQRSERIEQGMAWAKTFTWDRCRAQTVAILRSFA